MLSVYIFSLVLGGSFLLVSVLGDVFDSDVDLDGGADVDLALDAGDATDALEAIDAADAVEASDAAEVAHGTAAAKIFSIRGLIYGLFGFGAVGSAVTWLGGTGFVATLVAALIGGLLTGGMVTLLFNWLKSSSASNRHGDSGFVGLQGSITLPVGEDSVGTVMVERGGRRIALRARPWHAAEGDPSTWRDVVVMEMERGIARVAPIEEELRLEP